MTNQRIEMAFELRRAARELARQEQAMKELATQLDNTSDEDSSNIFALGITASESIRKFELLPFASSILERLEVLIKEKKLPSE